MIEINKFFKEELYTKTTELCNIMNKCGSDKGKGGGAHNYTTLYYYVFNEFRTDKLNILEVGMGTNKAGHPSSMNGEGTPGGSLHGWAEFFPNSNIFGADNDADILFQTNRIKTFYCDQWYKNTVDNMLNSEELININFDIIIDDGLHDLHCNLPFMEMIIDRLKIGGYYIIEDIDDAPRGNMANTFVSNSKNRFEYIQYLKIPLPENGGNNNIILIKK
jgi:hypothetical protein